MRVQVHACVRARCSISLTVQWERGGGGNLYAPECVRACVHLDIDACAPLSQMRMRTELHNRKKLGLPRARAHTDYGTRRQQVASWH